MNKDGLASDEHMARLRAELQACADKLNPLGRPVDSSCACKAWPCPCPCHKYDANREKKASESSP